MPIDQQSLSNWLVHRDLTGHGIRIRSFSYDRTFKRFYYGTASAYKDQYCMFGNPTVMPVKILWDYMIYWSITGFIFMHDQSCRQTMYLRNLGRLSKLGKLNHFMQDFFRQWHHATDGLETGGLVDISQIPLVRETNQRLKDEMTNSQFTTRFGFNVDQLETLCCEIVEHSGLPVEVPFKKKYTRHVRPNAFKSVFTSTSADSPTDERCLTPEAELPSTAEAGL